jgi:hypothetical protein
VNRLASWIGSWKDAASTFQSLTLGTAVLIGGLWGAYTFSKLQQARRAEIEISRP